MKKRKKEKRTKMKHVCQGAEDLQTMINTLKKIDVTSMKQKML